MFLLFFIPAGMPAGPLCLRPSPQRPLRFSAALSNKTELGSFYQHYVSIVAHLLYIVAGVCILKGLRKKGDRFRILAWGVLGFSLFWTYYSFLDSGGKHLRAAYDYVPGEPGSFLPLALCFLTWIAVLGYNRIHMNAHFLSDVCFGVLITYCLYALTYRLVFSIFRIEEQEGQKPGIPDGCS